MIGTTDWTGIAAVIAALGSALAAVVAALLSARNGGKLATPPNTPTIGQLAANVAAAVTTPDGTPTLGQSATNTGITLDHVHDVVCNGKTDGT